jgi:glycosyltransferase involved in cell wall biosynthesis
MGIGVVIPTHNRLSNLDILLSSLEFQTYQDFHVVISDDGSTDGTREFVEERARHKGWAGRLRWVGCGPDRGVRTGRARNIGAANLPAETRLLIMLDSDLILQSNALASFASIHVQYPSEVLLGLVEWLPSVNKSVLTAGVASGKVCHLRELVPQSRPVRAQGTFAGPELREGLYDLNPGQPVPLRPEWALPLNSGWPLHLYWAVGGFDETIVGYGYQDMDLGARAAAAGVKCLPRSDLWALHVWHPKPSKSMAENQRNLDIYLRRHGSNPVMEADLDWRLGYHYHSERGGIVVRSGSRLWAVSGDRQHRLALPDERWLTRLGHCEPSDAIREDELTRMIDHGTAVE